MKFQIGLMMLADVPHSAHGAESTPSSALAMGIQLPESFYKK
jgi:hypothetical protein